MKCNNCGKEIEGNDNYCEHCGRENIKPNPKKEKKKNTREFKREFTPRLCLEILLYVIAPIGVFLYLVLGTDLARYVSLIASLMIPGVVRIRGEDKSNREEFGKSMKGIEIILAVIVGIGLIVFIGWNNSKKCKEPEWWHNGERFGYIQYFWSDKEEKCISASDVFSYSVWGQYTQERCVDYEKCWSLDYLKDYNELVTQHDVLHPMENCDSDCYWNETKKAKLEYLKEINKAVGKKVVNEIW